MAKIALMLCGMVLATLGATMLGTCASDIAKDRSPGAAALAAILMALWLCGNVIAFVGAYL